ncbi:MAG: 2-isopropylmalate synthase, partial [Lentisphaeria bacterium]|nr:2-isopropylmalate synthase [Lentisphaeria bacterium]
QSGKGGVVYVLEKEFGICPPKSMHPAIGAAVQHYVDACGGEIDSKKLRDIFYESFVNCDGLYRMENYSRASAGEHSGAGFDWYIGDVKHQLSGQGNGLLSAVVRALKSSGTMPFFKVEDYAEHTLGTDADARAIAFVGLRVSPDSSDLVYGAGEHTNIDKAVIHALICAFNRAAALGRLGEPMVQ